MKSLLLFFAIFFNSHNNVIYSQISRTNIEFEEKIEVAVFDSTYNFPGLTPESLIGQTLHLIPEYGSRGRILNYGELSSTTRFRLTPSTKVDYTNLGSAIYLFKETSQYSGGSDYTILSNKLFKVMDVIRNSEGVFIKLFNEERNEEFYYIYHTTDTITRLRVLENEQFAWSFIVVGFYEKLTERLTGESFVLKNSKYSWLNDQIQRVLLKDITTGNDVKYKTGHVWRFEQLTLNEQNKSKLSMILSDESGQKIVVSLDYISKLGLGPDVGIYTKKEFDSYYQKYKDDIMLALESIVKIGFNKELVRLSISDYSILDINTSVIGSAIHEQWVLGGNRYIYFENGVVTSFQFSIN